MFKKLRHGRPYLQSAHKSDLLDLHYICMFFCVLVLVQNATGVRLAIPMPGHSVRPQEVEGVLEDCHRLKELVDEHEIVFLLTDTRESRWLPTLLGADANKVLHAVVFLSYCCKKGRVFWTWVIGYH